MRAPADEAETIGGLAMLCEMLMILDGGAVVPVWVWVLNTPGEGGMMED